jgi:hypothetical protein
MGQNIGTGRTLYDATVRFFNFCSVLGSLLREHTPLLNERGVISAPALTTQTVGMMYMPPGVLPDALPFLSPEPSSCSPPFSPTFAYESQSEIP